MHPELAGLLHTARLAIADDAPRLVVADWLEEHGTESDRCRADYIRLCLTLHHLPPWRPERRPLAVRRQEMEARHLGDWAGPLATWPGVDALQNERGLICLHLNPDALGRLDDLLALPAAAWVEGLRCWGWPADACGRLLRSPLCARFGSLGLGDCDEAAVRPHLIASPHLGNLAHLLLIDADLSSTGWAEVVGAGRLSPLAGLCLLGNRVGRDSLAAMRRSGLVGAATHLDLSQNRIGAQGMRSLARLGCDALRSLDLGWNQIGDRGLEALASSPLARNVERLDLSSNGVGPAGAEALAASPHLGRLASLDLGYNRVNDAGVAALANSPLAGRLEALSLRYNPVGDGGARAVLDSPLKGRLHRLDLSGLNGLSEGMKQKLKQAFGPAFVS